MIRNLTFSILLLFFFRSENLFSQSDSIHREFITVHFLYGSKPARGHKKTEEKWFGGIHGGHVYFQIDTTMFSFMLKPGWHIFPHRHDIEGGYVVSSAKEWALDTANDKYTSIRIPLTDSQYVILKNLETRYLSKSPYDYAFFGMRCASAAADVLSQLGILEKHSIFGYIVNNFYPKRLRKKLFRYAKQHHLQVIRKEGRKTRKWERD